MVYKWNADLQIYKYKIGRQKVQTSVLEGVWLQFK